LTFFSSFHSPLESGATVQAPLVTVNGVFAPPGLADDDEDIATEADVSFSQVPASSVQEISSAAHGAHRQQ
jgi:hypothetical protein